ncbi:MAG: helix-turn-helix transcriptional regulator [Bacteroidales bacterium]|jgi:DNA-binding CsgD family transcriptional regulator|nr:helix-turn-helix transcriptional regulator [Bacteroidales bacterium]
MKTLIDDFFDPVQYQGKMDEEDYQKIEPCVQTLDAFSRSSNISVYVIDYFRQNFLYVSTNHLFLNGFSVEEVMQMGYLYYQMFVPEDDLRLLQEINKAGFSFYYNTLLEDRLKYTISYDFHILNKNKRPILVNHKLTPMVLNPSGQVWLAMCTVTLSSKDGQGDIVMSKIDEDIEYVYSLQSRKWKKKGLISLSEREIDILRLSSQGLSNSEIGEKIFIDVNTVKFHKKNVFHKFDVKNITEAIAYAVNKKLI